MKNVFLITICFIVNLHNNLSAQYIWQNYAAENVFEDMVQSGDFMWIGNYGGLTRINLETMRKEVFQPWNSPIKGSVVVDIHADDNGKIWVGMVDGGLFKIENDDWTRYHTFLDDEYSVVSNIRNDKDGNLWFAAQRGTYSICSKLYRLKNEVVEEITGFPTVDGCNFLSFELKGQNELWLFYKNEILVYDVVQNKVVDNCAYSSFRNKNTDNVNNNGLDKSGNLIISSTKGLYKFIDQNWKQLYKGDIYSNNSILMSDGRVLLCMLSDGTSEKLYATLENDSLTFVTNNDFPSNPLNTNYASLEGADNHGGLWFFSLDDERNSHPLWLYKDMQWTNVDTEVTPLESTYIEDIVSDCNNVKWFVSRNSSINRFDDNEWQRVRLTKSNLFYASRIKVDPINCGLWLAGGNSNVANVPGLIYFKDSLVQEHLPGVYSIFDIEVDSMGTVYVCDWKHGLGIYRDGKWTWNTDFKLPINYINDMALGSKGVVYLSTAKKGLIKYDGIKFEYLGSGNSQGAMSYNVFVDNEQQVWHVAENGLEMFNGLDWIDYSSQYDENGMSGMVQDRNGNYWLSTWRDGLHYWTQDTIYKFDFENSSLRSNRLHGVQLDKRGKVWITESTGATSLQLYSYSNDAEKVKGNVFYDSNKSGTFDTSDFSFPGQKVVNNRSGKWVYSNVEGDFTHYITNEDSCSLSISNDNLLNITTYKQKNILLPQNENISFGLHSNQNITNVDFYLVTSPILCNIETSVTGRLVNKGYSSISGNIYLELSDSLDISNINQPYEKISDNKYKISVPILKPFENLSLFITLKDLSAELFGIPVSIKGEFIAQNINATTIILDSLLCSYDPNDKAANPTGDYFENYFLTKDEIRYTIRFENEGNYKATDVVIVDSLSSDLDINTFKFIGSSHRCEPIIDPIGLATFVFNRINLPPKVEGNNNNQGYVTFSIKPLLGTKDFTSIRNKADIYFDANRPIVTNTTTTNLVSDLRLVKTYDEQSNFSVFPNPSNGGFYVSAPGYQLMRIYDQTGTCVGEHKLGDTVNFIDVDCSSGLYMLSFINVTNGQYVSTKLVVIE